MDGIPDYRAPFDSNLSVQSFPLISGQPPALDSPRLTLAAATAQNVAFVLACVCPHSEFLAQGPRGGASKALLSPELRQVLEADPVFQAPSVLDRSLIEELQNRVFLRKEGGRGLEDRRRLVSNPLGIVPDGALDAPGEKLLGTGIEHRIELRRLLRWKDLLIVNLGRYEGETAGHGDNGESATKSFGGRDLKEGGVGEGKELSLRGIDRPGVLVQPPRGHGIAATSDLLEIFVIEAEALADLVADSEPAALQFVGSSGEGILSETKVAGPPSSTRRPTRRGGGVRVVKEKGLGTVHLGEIAKELSQPPREDALSVAPIPGEANHLGVLFPRQVEPEELLDPIYKAEVSPEEAQHGGFHERAREREERRESGGG